MATAEEIEVNVRQIEEPTTSPESTIQVLEVMRKLLLAGVGAFALSRDEAEAFLNRLVERGEIAQKDAQRLLDETMTKFRSAAQPRVNQAEHRVSDISTQVENNLEQFLNRLNIPSKRDIDELSAKIAQLSARVEELRRHQEVGTKPRAAKGAEARPEESTAA